VKGVPPLGCKSKVLRHFLQTNIFEQTNLKQETQLNLMVGELARTCAQASRLEAMVARLEGCSKKLLRGAQAYQQGLRGMTEGFATLAEHLHEFCGGPDEESMSVGALFPKFS